MSLPQIKQFDYSELALHLNTGALALKVGPFLVRLQSSLEQFIRPFQLLYQDHCVCLQSEYADFHMSIERAGGVRRWLKPQALFYFDGRSPFKPLPLAHAYAAFEWGLNWCISAHVNHFLIVHAAVVEKNGVVIILPATTGSGKSTLCAGLVSRGWRLFSDEHAMMRYASGELRLYPLARPISLKNRSIEVMQTFSPDVLIDGDAVDTVKGRVAHMRPPSESVSRASELGKPQFIIQPRYQKGVSTQLQSTGRAEMMRHLVSQCFNYNIQGRLGFDLLVDLLDQSSCYQFIYSDLDDAVKVFDRLALDA